MNAQSKIVGKIKYSRSPENPRSYVISISWSNFASATAAAVSKGTYMYSQQFSL